jgi:hypothetical protein
VSSSIGSPFVASRSHRESTVTLADATRVLLVLFVAALLAIAAAFWGPLVGSMLILVCVPFAAFVAMHARRDIVGLPVLPGLFVSTAFGVFFGAGLLAWILNGRHTTIPFASTPTEGTVLLVIVSATAFTTAFVCGERLSARLATDIALVRTRAEGFFGFSQLLFMLAAAGAALTIQRLGGWRAAVGLLITHNKASLVQVNGTAGLSLWAVFALPAMVALGIVAIERSSRRARVVAAFELGLLGYLNVTVFGSRLVLTLAAMAIAGALFVLRRVHLRLRALFIGIALLLLVSGVVLSKRAPQSPGSVNASHGQIAKLGYSIFDVSMAAWRQRSILEPQFSSTGRAAHVLFSAVPAFGPRQSTLNDTRVDVMTVRAVGTATQAGTTGLPPSLPTFALIAFGPLLAILFGFLSGSFAGAVATWLGSSVTPARALFFGLWVAFVFNDFKGGDPLVDFATEAKRWMYLGVLLLFVRVVNAWRA